MDSVYFETTPQTPEIEIPVKHIYPHSNLELHEKCASCGQIKFEQICGTLAEPAKQWTRAGGCANRTHGKVLKDETKPGQKIDPLKASKKAAKGLAKKARAAEKAKKIIERRDSR